MNKLKSIMLLVLFMVLIIIIILGYHYKSQKVINVIEQAKPKSFVYIEKSELTEDIKKYKSISDCIKKDIINTVIEESVKYDINPLILYSMLHVESSMEFWKKHAPVTIDIKGKKIKTAAIGLGGVIWEWWGDKLVLNGIAQVKSDLYDPIKNIKSVAFIYNELYKMPKHKSADSQDESAMLRYFGGDFKVYFERIDSKIGEVISKKLYRKI